MDKLAASLPLLQQKRDLYRSLLNVAFTNKVAWLDAEQAYTDQLHELAVQLAHGTEMVAAKAAETVLTAPIDGTVQALLTVVPDGGPVLIEATVENGDIGFVHAGQDVEVKVRTFEFTRYGLLHGHVVDVSRDRVMEAAPARGDGKKDADAKDGKPDETGYVAHVVLDNARMMVDGRAEPLSPGMAVTAEIKTGRRSVISYLLSSLRRYAHEWMRER